jgi:hypothetical protein
MDQSDVFRPVESFSWDVNRAERTQQVRLLVPLLDRADGRAWFLERLACPCGRQEALAAQVFHLCFPLRDIFTKDYCRCRGSVGLADQFIKYYNELFGFPEGFGVEEIWRTAPNGEIRHPAAGGRAGWYEDFLKQRVANYELLQRARRTRQILHTEADVFLLTASHVVIVECKYRSQLSTEQYERQKMTGETLARRLRKALHFGMVCEDERDPKFAKIAEPYVTWSEIEDRLAETSGACTGS